MLIRRVLLLVVLVSCIGALPLRAQSIGIEGWYRTGALTSVDRQRGAINTFNSNGAGSSIEHAFAIGAFLGIPVADEVYCAFHLTMGRVSGSFQSDPYLAPDSVSQKQFEVDTRSTLLESWIAAGYSIGHLHLEFGPLWDVYLGRSNTVRETSLAGVGFRADTERASSEPTIGRVALQMGASYPFPFSGSRLGATVRYDPYVNSFRSISDALQFGVLLSVPFTSSQKQDSAVIVSTKNVQHANGSTARLLIDGHDFARDSILPVSVTYLPRQQYEELPLVAAVDSLHFVTRAEASEWSERSVQFGDELMRDVLNVVASRVRRTPGARLLLECDAASRSKLAPYIRDVWGDSVTWSPSERNGFVRISASDAIALLPLSKKIVERSVSVPKIVVERGSGLGAYELTVLSGNDTILHKVQSSSETDNSVTELPALVRMERSLAVHVTGQSWNLSRTLTLVPRSTDTARSQLQIVLHPSYGNRDVVTNREALLRKLEGTGSVTVRVSGKIDAEAQRVLQRLPQPGNNVAADGPWTIRVEGTLPN